MIRRSLILAATLASLAAGPAGAQDEETPKVQPYRNGWYKQQFKAVGITYLADSRAELCYVSESRGGGIAEISCRELKRRPEWTPIIGWARSLKSKSLN